MRNQLYPTLALLNLVLLSACSQTIERESAKEDAIAGGVTCSIQRSDVESSVCDELNQAIERRMKSRVDGNQEEYYPSVTDAGGSEKQIGSGSVVGDINITIDWNSSDDCKLKIIQLTRLSPHEVRELAVYDLSADSTFQIRLSNGNENIVSKREKGRNLGDNSWDKRDFIIGDRFDAKIVPNYNGTGLPLFVGMEDARDAASADDTRGVIAFIDNLPFPYEKKLRFYFDSTQNRLYVAANRYTTMTYQSPYNMCKQIQNACFGTEFEICYPNSCETP